MRSVWLAAVVVASSLGCGGKRKPAPSAPAPAPALSNTTAEAEAPPAPPPTAWSSGVAACDEYLAVFDQLMVDCADKIGPAAEAMQEARDAMRASFAQWTTLKPDEREVVAEAATAGCKAGTDALRQTAVGMGCTLR